MPEGELDLVVAKPGLIVFVEVKARATAAFGDPSLAVTVTKQRRVRRLAAIWLQGTDRHGTEIRFDVVAILGVELRVIHAAF